MVVPFGERVERGDRLDVVAREDRPFTDWRSGVERIAENIRQFAFAAVYAEEVGDDGGKACVRKEVSLGPTQGTGLVERSAGEDVLALDLRPCV